ncbi:MAG: FkbM family methyltransferase [Chitinophagaceae bacterium]|nr:FkbM family methyltransferase [Chitinophagaceae bacterium]MCW5927392.1 FkbM family methyltransferase [Chitinophagaceae bacterium]
MFIYLTPGDHIQQQLFWYGFYEKELVLVLDRLIEKNCVFVDVGANIGYHTLVSAARASYGHVYAFEPVKNMFERTNRNIALNRLDNVTTYHLALGNTSGKEKIYVSANDNTGMSGLAKAGNFSGQIEEVSITTLDEWIQENRIEKIDILKIDVEGFDYKVLSGFEKNIERFKPIVIIEVIAAQLFRFGSTPADIYNFLESRGYKAFIAAVPLTLRPVKSGAENDCVVFLHQDYTIPSAIKIL